VKPIGFRLVSFTGSPAELKGAPAPVGLPTPFVEVVLNGAQVDVPLAPHTSIGWTTM
jgi:hypothetical protein